MVLLLKGNADKCHFLARSSEKINVDVDNTDIKSNKSEEFLNVKFEYRLTFDEHVSDLWKKACRKIYVLARVTPFMSIPKRRILMEYFLKRSSIIAG